MSEKYIHTHHTLHKMDDNLPLPASQELFHLVLGQALGVAGVVQAAGRGDPRVAQGVLGRQAAPWRGQGNVFCVHGNGRARLVPKAKIMITTTTIRLAVTVGTVTVGHLGSLISRALMKS